MTCIQFPEPPWYRDRTNSHKLSPDLGMGTYIHKNLRKCKGRKEYEKGHPRILGKLKFFFNVYEYFAGRVHLCPRCAPGALLDQKKALAPLELELGKLVSTMWVRELNPVPREEQC